MSCQEYLHPRHLNANWFVRWSLGNGDKQIMVAEQDRCLWVCFLFTARRIRGRSSRLEAAHRRLTGRTSGRTGTDVGDAPGLGSTRTFCSMVTQSGQQIIPIHPRIFYQVTSSGGCSCLIFRWPAPGTWPNWVDSVFPTANLIWYYYYGTMY